MQDEEDFRIKVRPRPKPKSEEFPKSSKLLNTIRTIVLTSTDDYLIKFNLADKLQAQPHQVGFSLSELVREGLLSPPVPVPGSEERVTYRGKTVQWKDGRWWENLLTERDVRKPRRGKRYRDVRTRASKREAAKVLRKHHPVESRWNGNAYYILRGTPAFRRAAKRAGLPEDPVADWVCIHCGKVNTYHDTGCRKCYKARYPKPEDTKTEVKKARVCNRCGGEIQIKMKNGKKVHDHGLGKCNLSLVNKIMSD